MPAPSYGDLFSQGASNLFGGGGSSGGAGGLFAGLFSSLLGNALTPNAPSAPQLPFQDQAATTALGDIGGLTNPYGTLQPMQLQQLMAYFNNPNIAGYLGGAKNAGAASTGAGMNDLASAGALTGAGDSLLNMGLDPQSALYNRTAGQVRDAANVTNSQYGLSTSPAGAGVVGQDMNNFNIDWQNQMLQRALQGTQGAGQAYTGASDLSGRGVSDILAGGQLPYSAYTGVLGDTTGAINQYGDQAMTGNNFLQTQIGDLMQYLGQGNSNAGSALAAYNAQNQAAAGTSAGLMPFFYSMFNQPSGDPWGNTNQPNPNNPTGTPAFTSSGGYPPQ